MNPHSISRRRLFRDVGSTIAALSVILSLAIVTVGQTGSAAAAGGVDNGAMQFLTLAGSPNPGQVVTSGGSATVFSMSLPQNASCPGGATGTPSYRWQTFMVDDAVDLATLTFTSGPVSVGGAFAMPMYETGTGDPIINQNPASSPVGLIGVIPNSSFEALVPKGTVPAGNYKIGIACTTAGATVGFWSLRIAVVADSKDSPAGFTWSLAAPIVVTPTTPAPTTPTTPAPTTPTTPAPTTPTTPAPTTPTTPAPTTPTTSTTTTVASTTTTSTIAGTGTGTTTTVKFGPSSTASTVQNGVGAVPITTKLATTGSSPLPIVIWAILLLVFGRMIILLGRPSTGRQRNSR